MKRRLIVFTFVSIILFLYQKVFGQNNLIDVVYLKNGSVIRGLIIEQVPNQTIKIQTRDKNIFVYKIDEIEKIAKEPDESVSSSTRKKKKNNNFKQKGYSNILELSTFVFLSHLCLYDVNGYQFSPHLNLGIGTGFESFFTASRPLLYLPVFVDFRANFIKARFSPFINLQTGYFHGFDFYFKGGNFNTLSLGLKTFISDKTALLTSLGIRYNIERYRDKNNIQSWGLWYNFMFRFGFAF